MAHPQIDGQTEVVKATYLGAYVETGQDTGLGFTSSRVCLQRAIHNSTGMSSFSIVYRKVPHHLLDLAKLPTDKKFSNAASAMAMQAIDVQKEVRTRLEKSNARHKAAADKRRRKALRTRRHGDDIL